MIPLAWQRRLDSASSTEEVLMVARQFAATFTKAEIERFPPHCRPGALVSVEEVGELAKCLSFSPIDGDAATVRLLTRLGQFFSAVEVRLAAIGRPGPDSGKPPA